MKMKIRCTATNLALTMLICVASVYFSTAAHGQTGQAQQKSGTKDVSKQMPEDPLEFANNYKELETKRLELISHMYGGMYEISGLFTELERAVKLEKLRNHYKTTMELLKLQKVDKSAIKLHQSKIDDINKHLEDVKKKMILPYLQTITGQDLDQLGTIEISEGFRRILENKVQEILKKTDMLSNIGAKVTELNNTSYISQNFKQKISWIFAALVGLVIIGFFIVAVKDEKIRGTIFSGDAGIQFLTLFSIVIAIILFGITGVLEGKEISALIGGITGYILGRSSVQHLKRNRGNGGDGA